MSEYTRRSCIDCAVRACRGKGGSYPEFCETVHMDEEAYEETMALYRDDEEVKRVSIAAAEVEAEYYGIYTRVEETMAFADRIGAKRIGIATCVGLLAESRTLARILRAHGFTVVGIACKAGATPKTSIGIPESCNAVGPNMCNPILQAKLLNREQTDLNVVVGLCVGHDSLFYRYSDALATTLVVKDRVLGNNPAAALYTAQSYYKRLLE